MARFLFLKLLFLINYFSICVFNISVKYCVAVSVLDLHTNPCFDGFCKMVTCQNVTNCYQGKIVQNASICGCCDACIRILGKNEKCDEYLTGSLKDIKVPRCENGLKCTYGKCTEDSGTMGPCLRFRKSIEEKRTDEFYADLWLPECDESGNFKAKQLKKRKAICYDKHGKKLFGQEQPEYSAKMTCACSRHLNDLEKKNGISFNILPQEHCTETGDFERTQCIDGLCYCANPITGEVDGRVVKKHYISRLPCYDQKLHSKGILKECEKELQRIRFLRFYFFQKGLEISELGTIRCDFDGTYSARQCDSTECWCTDKKGISIKSYFNRIEGVDILSKNRITNCDCARDVETTGSHRQYSALKCDRFGNYSPLQCFEDDRCFCVDEDGEVKSRMWYETEIKDNPCESNSISSV